MSGAFRDLKRAFTLKSSSPWYRILNTPTYTYTEKPPMTKSAARKRLAPLMVEIAENTDRGYALQAEKDRVMDVLRGRESFGNTYTWAINTDAAETSKRKRGKSKR